MKAYYDIENEEVVTEKELEKEYELLRQHGETEAETFKDYLANCLAGSLVPYELSWSEAKMQELMDKPKNEWSDDDWESYNYIQQYRYECGYYDD